MSADALSARRYSNQSTGRRLMADELSAEMRDAVNRDCDRYHGERQQLGLTLYELLTEWALRCQRAEAERDRQYEDNVARIAAQVEAENERDKEIADRADTEQSLVVELDKACTELDEARREAEKMQVERPPNPETVTTWASSVAPPSAGAPQPKDAFSTCPRCGDWFGVPVVSCAGCGYPNAAVYVTEWPKATGAPQPGEREYLRYLEVMLAAKNKWLKGLPTREEFDHLNAEFASLSADVASWFRTMERATVQIAAVRDLALALAGICGPFYPEVRELAKKAREP